MDTDALAELLNRGYRYARALTSDPVMAEDLVQEGWSAVLAARGPHTPGYLFRAIRTRWIDGQRRQKVVQMEALEHPDLVVAPPMSRPSDHAWLWQAFDSLRPAEREALFLPEEIAYSARFGEISVERWTSPEE